MIPPYLKPGDTIGITAPAHKITEEELFPAIDFLQKQGFRVKLSKNILAQDGQYAGNDACRISDFQDMLNDPEVKAILCARGGYGSVRLIDHLDFSYFNTHPKWICGYSDATVFHSHLFTHSQIPTIHSTMPISMQPDKGLPESNHSLIDALTGVPMNYKFPSHPLNRQGKAKGKIIGGNLSILYSLCGSASDICTDGALLFIEDLDEYLYHIDRMMMNMKRTGKLDHLAGLIVGGMSDMNDNKIPYGKTAEEIIHEHCKEYDYPVCFNFPAGHIQPNLAIRLGMEMELQVGENGLLYEIMR